MKYAVGDRVLTPSGNTVKILAIEPNRSGGSPFNYKFRVGREVWRVNTTIVDNY